MKLYVELEVLTTNQEANPATETVGIDKGLITEAGIYFPNGVRGVVRAKIEFQAHQIHPRNQEAWCRGDAGWWKGDLYQPVTAAPLEIKVIGWTPQANHNHVITAMIEIMPWDQVPAWGKVTELLTRLSKTFGIILPKKQKE